MTQELICKTTFNFPPLD